MAASNAISRRRFLESSSGALGAGWLALNWSGIVAAAEHAHAAAAAAPSPVFELFDALTARDVGALAEQILPRTGTAGAQDAGVPYFIDHVLRTLFADQADRFAAGYADFARTVAERYGSDRRYADLDAAQQLAFAEEIESTAFFAAMRQLTVLGFLASPAHGGNRDQLGWRAVGFTDEFAFAPPFGDYDRDYRGFEPYPVRRSHEEPQ
jgi:gluconate 2-dehydrogenase gamma chain